MTFTSARQLNTSTLNTSTLNTSTLNSSSRTRLLNDSTNGFSMARRAR